MVNIYDVAVKAGVSRSTVSRVINGSPGVNEETREKVLEAMKKLNYSPNASARSLALKKNKVIAVVSKIVLNDPFYSKVNESIYRIADQMGYGTFFYIKEKDMQSNSNYFEVLYGKVDGIIFLGYDTISREDLIRFIDVKFPVVLFINNINIPGIVTVNVDNYYGGYIATRYLIQKGHKKIGHFRGLLDSFEVEDRLDGYMNALQDYNIPYDGSLLLNGEFSYVQAYNQADKFLNNKEITAVFCDNDLMALGVIDKAVEMGYKIPGDVSVIGYDDISYDLEILKKNMLITTIRQPLYEMSEYAVKALVENIEEHNIVDNKVFTPSLVDRGTVRDV